MLTGLTSYINATALILAAATRDEEEFVTELRHVPEGWLGLLSLGLVVSLCWIVVWMYRHEGRLGASLRVRTGLAVVRCMVIVSLATIFLEPVRVRILRKWIDSYTLVLLDDSSSMDLTDRYRDPQQLGRVRRALGSDDLDSARRGDLLERLLERDNRAFMRKLTQRNRVKLYAFADEARELVTLRASREEAASNSSANPDDTTRPTLSSVDDMRVSLPARGPSTNVERGIRRAVDSIGSAPLAGIVVLSDGGFNQGAGARDVAALAEQRGLSIYTVGIGDSSEPKNIRVSDVQAPPNAFQKDPFVILGQVSSQGMDGQMVTVELEERLADTAGSGRVVDTRRIEFPEGGGVQLVSFQHKQNRPGRYLYTIRVPVQPFESVADDNARQTSVRVIDAKTRVLLISGGPSWEYRYVTRLLERDDTFDVSCWLQSADISAVRDGNTVIDHLPRLAEELFAYDVIILMDPERSEFDNPLAHLLDTFVTKHGGGLLFASARANTPDFLRDDALAPLHDLLPIVLDPEADLILNRVGHYQLKPAPIIVPDTAFSHPILQLAGDVTLTRLLWQQGADIYWHYPVARAKPVATVLMRHGDPRMRNTHGSHVLAAVQFVAAGRTGFIAFDGTWRWRRFGAERFDRFWVQTVRYLAEGKLLGASRRGSIITEGDQFPLGTAVSVSARLYDSRYEPIRRDHVVATFEFEGERGEFTLRSRAGEPGWFEGKFLPDRPGSYSVSLSVPDPLSGKPTEATHEIRISRPNLEVLRPQMDRAKLVALAEGSAGGQYFEIDEMLELADMIPDLHEEIAVRSRPQSLWDNAVVLTILITLLGIEWALRKWNRLL